MTQISMIEAASYEPASAEDVDVRQAVLSPRATAALIEDWLERLMPDADTQPRLLHRAMRHAVFSGSRRLRPRLLLHVVQACGAELTDLAIRAACATELIHAASLVHDDLPFFGDTSERHGRPTVHVAFGKRMAVLAGDALVARAFEIQADVAPEQAARAMRLVRLLVKMTGSSSGIIGRRTLEPSARAGMAGFSLAQIERYHQVKTGALFRLATEAAAVIAESVCSSQWGTVGQLIGLWCQLTHDGIDVHGHPAAAGRSVGAAGAHGNHDTPCAACAAEVVAQMRTLREETRSRVMRIAVRPEPLLHFLDILHGYLLRAVGVPVSTCPDQEIGQEIGQAPDQEPGQEVGHRTGQEMG